MIKYIANTLSQKFVSEKILCEKDKEICSYGLEIIISSMVSICLVLIISIMNVRVMEGVIYLLFYCLLRTYAGGYHAKSHKSCILTFVCTYIAVICITKLSVIANKLMILFLVFFCIFVVTIFKTVDTINNPFSVHNKKKMHKIAIGVMLCQLLLIFFMLKVSALFEIGIYALFGTVVCCILIVIGFIENIIIREEKNE